MPVETFECQIARGQINRYLAGENFSSEGMRQLEEHVATCDGCKEALAERKKALQRMLGTERPIAMAAIDPEIAIPVTQRATTPATEKSTRTQAADQIRAALQDTKTKAVATPKGSFTKPLIYAAALAVTLIGMGYMTRTGNGLLGPKVTATTTKTTNAPAIRTVVPPTPKPAVTAPTAPRIDVEPIGHTIGSNAATIADTAIETPTEPAVIEKPIVRKTIKPRATHRKPSAKKMRRSVKRPAATKLPAGEIRIFEPTGKPVTEN